MVEVVQVLMAGGVVAAAAVGLYLLYWGASNLSTGWTIWRNDPINAGSVRHVDGIVEVQGTVEALKDHLLTAKYTNTPAVAYEYKKQEKKRKQTTDGETEHRWVTVESGTATQPFYVADETGKVAVDPDNATVSLDTNQLSGDMSLEIGSLSIGSQTKLFEGRLEPGDHVHVYGQKREPPERDGPGGEPVYIADGEQTDTFTVSDTTESGTVLRYLATGVVSVLAGLAVLGAGGFVSLLLLQELGIAEFGVTLLL